MWESVEFPTLPALSIPHHSKDIRPRTTRCILDQLEDDILAWDNQLPDDDDSDDDDDGGENGTG